MTAPSVYIETAGCAFNTSDSEVMAGILTRSGYNISQKADGADVVVLNTCTVKDRTFFSFRKRLEELRARTPVVIAGCIPKAYEKTELFDRFPTVGPDSISRIDEVVREALRGRVLRRLERDPTVRLPNLPKIRKNPVVEILPIARGCRSACTFCQTRLARGRLSSFTPAEILSQARRALDEGVRIFWVTGQDTAAYGHDIDVPLPRLLEELLNLAGDFHVRLGMSSPRWIAEILEQYLDILEHPKMFKFLHVPLQSGSSRVLAEMKRDGTIDQFEEIHNRFLDRFPNGSFVTDLIVGYPTETAEDFDATMNLIRRLELGFINCSKFSPRPGTAATKLKPLPSSEVSSRSKRLMELVRTIGGDYLNDYIGRTESVVIEESENEFKSLARTINYRPVVLNERLRSGMNHTIKIESAKPFHFTGSRIDSAQAPQT